MIEDASVAFSKCRDTKICILRGGTLPSCDDLEGVQDRFRTVGGGKIEGVSVGRWQEQSQGCAHSARERCRECGRLLQL